MNDIDNKFEVLRKKLTAIHTVSALMVDRDSNSVGVSFEYMGVTYTTYIDVDSERGELLRHDVEDMARIENIGAVEVCDLLGFFSSLPTIETILR